MSLEATKARTWITRIPIKDSHWIGIGSLCIALVFLAFVPEEKLVNRSPDYTFSYEPAAEGFLSGRGFTDATGEVLAHHPPGYAFILSGAFTFASVFDLDRGRAIAIMNAFLFSLAATLLFLIAKNGFGRAVAWGTLVLFALYPINYFLLTQSNSELPFIVVLFATLLCWLQCRDQEKQWPIAVSLGALLAIAMYVRAIALFLPVIAALATLVFPRFWGIRNRFQFVSLMLFTICTCLAPWELWLYKKTGSWTLLSTAPSSSIADGLRLEDRDISSTTFTALPSDVREFVLENRTTPLKSTTAVLALLFRTLSERPVMLIKFGLLKASYCWYLTHSGAWQTQLALLNGFYLLLAGIGLWMVRHQKKASARPLLATSVALVLYFWGLATVAMAIHRYLFPIMGLIFMFAAVCLVRIWAMLPPLQDVLE